MKTLANLILITLIVFIAQCSSWDNHWHPLRAFPKSSALILSSKSLSPISPPLADSFEIQSLLLAGLTALQHPFQPLEDILIREDNEPNFYLGINSAQTNQLEVLLSVDRSHLDEALWENFLRKNDAYLKQFQFGEFAYRILQKEGAPTLAFYEYKNLLLFTANEVHMEASIHNVEGTGQALLSTRDLKHFPFQLESEESALYINTDQSLALLSHFYSEKLPSYWKLLNLGEHWMKVDLSKMNRPWLRSVQAPLFSDDSSASKNDSIHLEKWATAMPQHTDLLYIGPAPAKNTSQEVHYQKFLEPKLTGKVAYAWTNLGAKSELLFYLETTEPKLIMQQLEAYGATYGMLKQSDYQTYPIRQFLSNEILAPFASTIELDKRPLFFTSIDRFLIFSEELRTLERLIDQHITAQNLYHLPAFQLFSLKAEPTTTEVLFLRAGALDQIIMNGLRQQSSAWVKEHWQGKKISWSGGWLAKPGKVSMDWEMTVHSFQEPTVFGPQLQWQTSLSQSIAVGPQFLEQPGADRLEIVVQDEHHQLYLLNEMGEIMWTVELDGRLLSKVYLVDYQEDGNLYYLCNTANNIYLFDRRGEPVGDYPIRLQSPATNGLCLTASGRGYAYQMFLVAENGHAYGYTKDGVPLNGWNPRFDVGQSMEDIIYLQSSDKDALVIMDTTGSASLFDLDGRLLGNIEQEGRSWQKVIKITTTPSHQLVLLDTNGRIELVSLNDLTNKRSTSMQNANYELIDKVSEDELLMMSVGEEGRRIYSLSAENLQFLQQINTNKAFADLRGIPLKNSEDYLLSLYDTDNHTAYLYVTQRAAKEGFEIRSDGTVEFITRDWSTLILTGLEHKIFCYQWN